MARISKEEKPYVSHILINKNLRYGFFVANLIIFFVLILLMIGNVRTGGSWYSLLVPIILFSLPLMLYPPSEDWVYEPWQVRAQKYERHFVD